MLETRRNAQVYNLVFSLKYKFIDAKVLNHLMFLFFYVKQLNDINQALSNT